MSTTDSRTLAVLQSLRDGQSDMFLSFKCAAQLQIAGCDDEAPLATNDAIIEILENWSASAGADKQTLMDLARDQLN